MELAPSLLSCDFSYLEKEIRMAEEAGCRYIHWDVMDGHFVPNITVGIPVIASLRKKSNLIFDVHLMIEDPDKFVKPFKEAGSNIITFHIETIKNPDEIIDSIKKMGVKVGVAIIPSTPLESIYGILDKVDLVLIMTVNPGFGGQSFLPEVIPKIEKLKSIMKDRNLNFLLEVDGGINLKTVTKVLKAGANLIVAGSSIYHSKDPKETIQRYKDIFISFQAYVD
ncbi:ribulose-phosphate 3-epimerase [bacterium]|nr:ribulose-phosphate 3-epimerase [bacterium]